ncbi:MAG: hypothetical protein MUO53_15630 [Maribacter sp.]|nr:hypothetical protein [Maribacter sp.]
MGIKEGKRVPAVKRFWIIIRKGLFLMGLQNRLAKLGIDIMPYYWVQEGFEPCPVPSIKGNTSEYMLRYLSLEEIEIMVKDMPRSAQEEMIDSFKKGQLCIGLEHHNEIAAYMFMELNDFDFKHKKFKLKNNQAYLLNMWTFNAFRGRNLAPYLRYQSYQLLKEMGKDTTYSITHYFNKSSIKFKEKLKAKPLQLYLYVGLFGKIKKHYLIKTYS